MRAGEIALALIAATSFIAGLATAPYAIFHFNRYALYGVAANMIAVPISSFWVMPWGLIAMLLMPLGLETYPLIAMGWVVAEADSYAARLEAALGPRFEVLNFGIAGLDALESVERFHAKALDFDPDLVVYGFTLNDVDNRHYRHSAADLGLVHRELMAHPSWLWASVLLPRLGALREVLVAPPLHTWVPPLIAM